MIKFENILVKFRGEDLFGNLTFEIPANSKTLIAGKSGYGKSTLFSILLGFFKPSGGEAYFNGVKITGETVWEIRKKIAYVDQEASVGFGAVKDWFAFIGSLKANQKNDFSRKTILEKFGLFDLPKEIYEEKIENLSGGERQRIALVTALLLNREVFLLDEPTSALDVQLKKKVVKYFAEINETVVVVSHDEIWRTAKNFKIFDMEQKQWVR